MSRMKILVNGTINIYLISYLLKGQKPPPKVKKSKHPVMHFYGVFSHFWEVLYICSTLNHMSNFVYPPLKAASKNVYPLIFSTSRVHIIFEH